jgi:BON domain
MARFTLGSALFGAAAMYLFDPDRGKRRRALVRDQFVKAVCNVRDVFDAASRDFVNRGAGLVGETRSLLNRDAPIDDVLVERVRAKIGRYTQHPGAIEVGATAGEVTLTGSILEEEHQRVLDAVRSVRGVRTIVDRLTVYQTAEGVSELQGGKPRPGELPELLQDNWSPSTRIVAGATGAMLALYSLRGGLPGLVLGAAGALILLRSTANRPLKQLTQLTSFTSPPAIDVQEVVEISAPVDTAAHV